MDRNRNGSSVAMNKLKIRRVKFTNIKKNNININEKKNLLNLIRYIHSQK